MGNSWNEERARTRVNTRLDEVETVTIKEYVRDTDLGNLKTAVAYRVDGVHVYVDIVNLREILGTTETEGVTCHRRALRFLDLHYRAVRRILQSENVLEVDFHNQRLHAAILKPYGNEELRLRRAIAVAQMIINVLRQTGEESEDIPSAKVRIGIDSGTALAVNNGRKGHREPLFLGEPANRAAKRAGGGVSCGIYPTNVARIAMGFSAVDDEDREKLTQYEISQCEEAAELDASVDEILKKWREDLRNSPIGRFDFRGHTPPLSSLDFELLSPTNSRRQIAISVYADLDGFTSYVSSRLTNDEGAKDVVRVLHVLRSELDAVLDTEFGGKKVRFIGDCVHGLVAEGTAQTTDEEASVETATLLAGGLRSSFDLSLELLRDSGIDTGSLGLAIGFELGSVVFARLGMKGGMVRCGVGRAVLESEAQQLRCDGDQAALGIEAYNKASEKVRDLFGVTRRKFGLTYPVALEAIKGKPTASNNLLQAASAAPPLTFPNKRVTPSKPAGFA